MGDVIDLPGRQEANRTDLFERWLAGEDPTHGPAVRIILARAREEVLAARALNNSLSSPAGQ